MKNKFPKLHTSNLAQELYTPESATKLILPFIEKFKGKKIWEMCYGKGNMANVLKSDGHNMLGDQGDCFIADPEFDLVVTNPPYRNNKEFVKRALKSGKPFALLMRLEHMGGGEAYEIFKDLDVKILIPKRRIDFITPKMREGKKVGGSPFHTIWITYKIVESDKQLIYIDYKK